MLEAELEFYMICPCKRTVLPFCFVEVFLGAWWLGAKLQRFYQSGGAKKPVANPTKTGPKL
jgi:hypothetical protein